MKALSRLRMSSHMLEIERGRHVKPQKLPLEQRTCQRCTSNSIDDEIHFLITCSYFATQRTSLLAESKLLNSEFDSTHRPLVICLAKYTYSCFQTLSVSRTSALLRTNVHKVQIRTLARRKSVLHPRHKVDEGTIKIKN